MSSIDQHQNQNSLEAEQPAADTPVAQIVDTETKVAPLTPVGTPGSAGYISSQFPPESLVWAKVKGFPWWPAKVLQHAHIPLDLLEYRRSEKSLPLLFFGTRDYMFVPEGEVKAYEENKEAMVKLIKKNRPLRRAYEESLTPEVLDMSKAAAAAALGEEEEGDETVVMASGKRKVSAGDGDGAKRAKGEAGEPKRRGRHAKTFVKPAKPTLTPEQRLVHLRHRLQKIFLSTPMQTQDFGKVDALMKHVEDFDISVDMLRESKIGKVLKRISTTAFEGNEPANVVARSLALIERWKALLPAVTANADMQSPPQTPIDGAHDTSIMTELPDASFTADHSQERLFNLRCKLQRIFLSQPLRTDDFHKVDGVMTEIEQFPITVDMLKETKIGKVLKRISLIASIENEPANVLERAKAVVERWNEALSLSFVAKTEQAVAAVGAESTTESNVHAAVESAVSSAEFGKKSHDC